MVNGEGLQLRGFRAAYSGGDRALPEEGEEEEEIEEEEEEEDEGEEDEEPPKQHAPVRYRQGSRGVM
jgi:hypothetical protein